MLVLMQQAPAQLLMYLTLILLLAGGLLLLSRWMRLFRANDQNLRIFRGLCPGCGYDLTGIDRDACPECGRPLTDEEKRRLRNIAPALPRARAEDHQGRRDV